MCQISADFVGKQHYFWFFTFDPSIKQGVGYGKDFRPDKDPTMPKTISPPVTPANTSSIGRSAPFFIRMGLMVLSIVPRKIAHTARTLPQTVWSVQMSQITAGRSTDSGPT